MVKMCAAGNGEARWKKRAAGKYVLRAKMYVCWENKMERKAELPERALRGK